MTTTETPNQRLGGAATAAGELFAIVYVSKAARPMTLDDLHYIQERAQIRNPREGVTGILLYSDGAFMQYLEGPAIGLTRVYEVIKPHPWHYGLIDIYREPIAQREFSEWSLAFRLVDPGGEPLDVEQDALLAHQLADPSGGYSLAREHLIRFWTRGRSSLASTLEDFARERARRVAALQIK